jgi:hypothetical protein
MKVAQALEQAKAERGRLPGSITVDNGTEFSSRALEAWVMSNDVQLCFIRPGRPVENGFIERFNGRLRDECLNVEWFVSLQDARQKLAHSVRVGGPFLGERISLLRCHSGVKARYAVATRDVSVEFATKAFDTHLASRCTKALLGLRIDPRRLMSKLLHVLNV